MSRALIFVFVLGAPAVAHAQACCAGASLLSPARLTPFEDALVGLQLEGSVQTGSTDADGRFAGAGRSTAVDLTFRLHHTLRLADQTQLTWTLPVMIGVRSVPGLSEAAVAPGDVVVSLRHDFSLATESESKPGLALLASVTAPSGIAPEAAHTILGADASGRGSWELSLGAGYEKRWGALTLQVLLLAQERLPRRALGITQVFGPGLALGGALAWTFDSGLAAALTVNATAALPSWVDGTWNALTARAKTGAGLMLATPLVGPWRLQASLVASAPLGVNEVTTVAGSVLLMRSWF